MVDLDSVPTLVKICGITTVHDALMARDRGASAIGLVFAESKRRVSLETACAIATTTAGELLRFGVFRHDPDDFVIAALDAVHIDVAQIHGELSGPLLAELRNRGISVVKALALGAPEFDEFDESNVDAVLVDGPIPGSGVAHSWDEVLERHFGVPVIAAGGLTPDNVASVIVQVRPWGVDVSSGVESAPGTKDPELVSSFIERAREGFSRVEGT